RPFDPGADEGPQLAFGAAADPFERLLVRLRRRFFRTRLRPWRNRHDPVLPDDVVVARQRRPVGEIRGLSEEKGHVAGGAQNSPCGLKQFRSVLTRPSLRSRRSGQEGYSTFKIPFIIRAWKVQTYSLSPGRSGASKTRVVAVP